MKGYICWNPDMIDRVMDTEALHVSNHIFLATHHPIKMFKETSRQGDGTMYDEEQFLKDFMNPKEYIFAAILGQAGTGKSHLVRWLAAQIESNERRRVLLIPRSGTNLRKIIYMILDNLEGRQFDEYRDRLNKATGQLSPIKAREMFINHLATAIGPSGNHQWDQLTEEEEYFAQYLHHLFYDPYFREILLQEGGIIHKLTKHILGQNQTMVRLEERRQFTVDDLPLNVRDLQNASKHARNIYSDLLADPELKEQAVVWINKKLNDAIAQMLNFQGNDLKELMADVRATLAEQDVELVILIEDFAVLQGIDFELLEALLVKPRQLSGPRLCNLRVALACTTGYYKTLPDTVRTRIDFRVCLDIETNGVMMTQDNLREFVGRYLNALRFKESDLKEWHQSRLEGKVERKVPSACQLKECPYIEKCHNSFGHTNNRGLYPFNKEAIKIMYKRLFEKDNPLFNPRVVIKDVLRHTLSNYGENIRTGTFPPPALLEHFGGTSKNRLRTIDLERLKSLDVQNAARREVLLELWNDKRDIMNLDPVIHKAFNLPILEELKSSVTVKDVNLDGVNQDKILREKSYVQSTSPFKPVDPKLRILQDKLRVLDNWKQGERMPQGLGQELREILYKHINDYIDWDNEFLIQTSIKSIWKKAGIGFLNGTKNMQKFQLQLPLDGDDLNHTAIALQAMLQHKYYGHWKFENGSEYFRFFARYIRRWSEDVVSRLKKFEAGNGELWDPVPYAVEVLAIGCALQGEIGYGQSVEMQINALFKSLQTPLPNRSRRWKSLEESLLKYHSIVREILLERTTCTKGSSKNYKMIDAARIASELQNFWSKGSLSELLPQNIDTYFIPLIRTYQNLGENLSEAVKEEKESILNWYKKIVSALGENPNKGEVINTLEMAIQKAKDTGVWRGPDPSVLKDSINSFKSLPLKNCLNQAINLQEGNNLLEQVIKLGRFDTIVIDKTEKFIDHFNQFLMTTMNQASRELNKLQQNQKVQELEKVKIQIAESFDDLWQMIEEVTGGAPIATNKSEKIN